MDATPARVGLGDSDGEGKRGYSSCYSVIQSLCLLFPSDTSIVMDQSLVPCSPGLPSPFVSKQNIHIQARARVSARSLVSPPMFHSHRHKDEPVPEPPKRPRNTNGKQKRKRAELPVHERSNAVRRRCYPNGQHGKEEEERHEDVLPERQGWAEGGPSEAPRGRGSDCGCSLAS